MASGSHRSHRLRRLLCLGVRAGAMPSPSRLVLDLPSARLVVLKIILALDGTVQCFALLIPEATIRTVLSEQLALPPALNDMTILKHENIVSGIQLQHLMRNHYRGPAFPSLQ